MDRIDGPGAAAAAKYFLSLYAYSLQTGDFIEWEAMSTPVCTFCSRIREDARKIAKDGNHYFGGEITVTKTEVGPHDDGYDAYPVETSIAQQPSRQTDSEGLAVVENAGRSGSVRVEVMNRPAGWGILEIVSEGS